MTVKRQPRIARWILEHATPGQRWSESLSGDLAEQWSTRSHAWYWRQVMGAFVAGWAKEIYRLRLAIVFTLLCVFPEPLFWIYCARVALYREFFVWSVSLPWPWSLVFQLCMLLALAFAYIWICYAVYLALSGLLFRAIKLHRAMQGLLTAAWVYIPAQVVVLAVLSYMTFAPINLMTAGNLAVLLAPAMMLLCVPSILAMVCAIRTAIPFDAQSRGRLIAS